MKLKIIICTSLDCQESMAWSVYSAYQGIDPCLVGPLAWHVVGKLCRRGPTLRELAVLMKKSRPDPRNTGFLSLSSLEAYEIVLLFFRS